MGSKVILGSIARNVKATKCGQYPFRLRAEKINNLARSIIELTMPIGALVYTTKIAKFVCRYVSMCVGVYVHGYAPFRRALRYRAENWHGGRGRANEVCGHIFDATPIGHQ